VPSVHETSFVGVSTMGIELRSGEEFMEFLTIVFVELKLLRSCTLCVF